ncbi:MAG: hypothetical protein JXB23_00335 [Candidatus Aminicenantes bacterium]|nr:hypothetical protein [Candidatus Aminicenantes bacterium]
MFSKIRYRKKIGAVGCALCVCLAVAMIQEVLFSSSNQKEIVDRVEALVNDDLITLSDLKIITAFGLFSSGNVAGENADLERYLDELIDRKVVLQLAGEAPPIQKDVLDTYIDEIIVRLGAVRFRGELQRFGMDRKDLEPYVIEWLAFRKIITDRFKTSASVSLKDIENYYELKYLPEQKEKGREAKPMLDVLNEIEESLKQEKNKKQIEEWIDNLRKKSEIQIFHRED